jgi:hypothetical protein
MVYGISLFEKRKEVKYLGGNNQIVSLPAEFLDRLAHNALGFPAGVALRAVEEVDADVVGGFHAGECVFWDILLV